MSTPGIQAPSDRCHFCGVRISAPASVERGYGYACGKEHGLIKPVPPHLRLRDPRCVSCGSQVHIPDTRCGRCIRLGTYDG